MSGVSVFDNNDDFVDNDFARGTQYARQYVGGQSFPDDCPHLLAKNRA